MEDLDLTDTEKFNAQVLVESHVINLEKCAAMTKPNMVNYVKTQVKLRTLNYPRVKVFFNWAVGVCAILGGLAGVCVLISDWRQGVKDDHTIAWIASIGTFLAGLFTYGEHQLTYWSYELQLIYYWTKGSAEVLENVLTVQPHYAHRTGQPGLPPRPKHKKESVMVRTRKGSGASQASV